MLENLRRQGASIVVYLIFCLLIVIFVINFRPGQTRQQDSGCRGTSNMVVTVDGTDATQSAYRVAYSGEQPIIETVAQMIRTSDSNLYKMAYWLKVFGIQPDPMSGQIKYKPPTGKMKTHIALEVLIRRELLAQAAEELGLLVSDDLIVEEIKRGHFYYGGTRIQFPGAFEDIDGEKFFNRRALDGWLSGLNVSRNSYIEEQKRGMLATMMADLLDESVQVSSDEALQHFLFEHTTASYDVVTFRSDVYRAALRLTDADIDRYVTSHEDEVKARYKVDERTYKAVKPQDKLRQIFIAKPEEPKPDKKDDKKPDDKKPSPGMPIEVAKAKLEDVRAGKLKFADAAKQLNTDETARLAAGDLGWHTADNAMLGEKAVSDAVKALKKGEMSPVIATDRGVYLLLVEDTRAGDLTFEQVKHELAADLARETWGKEAARSAAIAALQGASTGVGLKLDQLYEVGRKPGPAIDLQKILQDPNLSDEQKQQILKQYLEMQQQQGPGEEHGAIEFETRDQPAAWYAEGEGAGGGSSAGSASGSGSAAAAPPAPPAEPPKPVDLMTPSKEQLPQLSPVEKPKLERFVRKPRAKPMEGLGSSAEAIAAVFDQLAPGSLAKTIYQTDEGYIVIQLIDRPPPPDKSTFDKQADERIAALRRVRAETFVEQWLKDRCEKLYKSGQIKANEELLVERNDEGKVLPVTYRPCWTFE
jgi:parvulin-like peptidyl-prolyl isomerase